MTVRHISVTIRRTPDEVYAFAREPANLPRWARGLSGTIEYVAGEWIADSPMGKVKVRFAPPNPFGVLDHEVVLPSGEVVQNPLRVVANGDGSELTFTLLRRPGVSDAELDADAEAVARDLAALAQLLEQRAAPAPSAPPLKPPALAPATLPARSTSSYPEPFRSRVLPREKRALGDALGLTKIGVNLTTLWPGKESSLRHCHTHEDELVFILEGEVVLRTDDGEQLLPAGTCAGFPAGSTNAHQLVNRSSAPARYLEISNRDLTDSAAYPDDDLAYRKSADGRAVFTHKDGTSY